MCGLTGFWSPGPGDPDTLASTLARMTAMLVQRGPDDHGKWIDPCSGIALGFRRLAIVDLTQTGHQPMVSADRRYVIVYNGEIYNDRELRAELAGDGLLFHGASDTEVILRAVMRWGLVSALERVWGMFAIALWDRETQRLSLARDRMGKKPLYFGVLGRTLVFGSEVKALRAHPGFVPAVDRSILAQYVRLGYVPPNACIYAGIRQLPPGSVVEYQSPAATATPSA